MRLCPCVGWVKVPESKGSAGSVGAAYSHPQGQQPSWCLSHPSTFQVTHVYTGAETHA